MLHQEELMPMSPRMRRQVAEIQKYLTDEFNLQHIVIDRKRIYLMALGIWRILRHSVNDA